MSMESALNTLLVTLCPRVFADVHTSGVPVVKPYVIWQALGGESLRYGDNTAPDKRDTLMQISVWAGTRNEALDLIRSVEDALCASAAFQCKPEGEPLSTYEPETRSFGSIQRFSIWSDR